ncbi:glycosyltransferase, partial [Methylobacterium sp. WL30]|uniref:glycosyltransferase family 2 protein n=1 Tax=unclassified Methylobacterium TaxID=2615210 RepID=UPI0011CB8087
MHSPDTTRISFLVPVYNTPPDVLEATIRSVLEQTSPDWELCLYDDASPNPEVGDVLEDYRGSDARIKIVRARENRHIARATNAAAEFATGQFVGFLDHDDALAPHAVATMLAAIIKNPDADLLYTDEDKLEPDGRRSESYFKPDWSPEHLQSVMYVMHLTVMRKHLFFALGGLRHAYTGAQDYDLALRATAAARAIVHVPGVLYHWRKIPGSAAAVVDAKPQALVNAQAAIADFVRTQDPAARVEEGLFQGSFRVIWPLHPERRVTLLILTNCAAKTVEGRGEIVLVHHAVASIRARSTWTNYEIVVVDNGNMSDELQVEMKAQGVRLESHEFEPPFNFSRKMNFALSKVRTEDVILLNDDIEVIAPDWIEALIGFTGRPGVGAVGARLLYPNGRVQHQGVVFGVMGNSTHIFHNLVDEDIGYNGYTHLIRNYSAVTGAVLATRMSLVREVGGFDEALAIDYNDLDFCLRLGQVGYRIVYTPFAKLYHFEGSSLPRTAVSSPDEAAFTARWAHVIAADPFYNPHLSTDRGDYYTPEWS